MMRRSWAGEEISAETPGFAARGTLVLPPVAQTPHPPLWIHGNSPFGVERAGRYGQGWLGMMTRDNDVLVRTTRTTPLPDLDVLARRIDEVRCVATAAGRDPDAIDIVVAGAWPMLDVRAGRPAEAYLEQVARLEKLGVTWAVCLCCGDDPRVAQETVERFGEEVIRPGRQAATVTSS
jgi:alkanesulfonate monooxygenase SsuD/methylene tetrahydromethanopterin reductase-like flavin-dependent oxidoreductase (luciferase family)